MMMQGQDEADIIATLRAMRLQEDKSYLCATCCYKGNEQQDEVCSPSPVVTSQTRQMLGEWCYKIIDFCDLDRETVEIAMSHVDRCVQTAKGRDILFDSSRYQLLVVTALYTSVKQHSEYAISIKQFERISRGCFTVNDLKEMECFLLEALGWHMNPPTSLSFVRLFLRLVPTNAIDEDQKETAYILSRIQTELAVFDSEFVNARASTIAFASVLNAFEALGFLETASGNAAIQSFSSKAASTGLVNTDLFYKPELLKSIQRGLYHAIAKQGNPLVASGGTATKKSRRGVARNKSFEESPRSIISRMA